MLLSWLNNLVGNIVHGVQYCYYFKISLLLLEPLASPANVKATSKVGPDKIFVEWEHVPKPLLSGIRRGYTVIYQKVTDVGVSVLEKKLKFDVFDPDQREALLEGLDYYAEYSIKVRVFNRKMSGDPSEPVYASKENGDLFWRFVLWATLIYLSITTNQPPYPTTTHCIPTHPSIYPSIHCTH